MCKSQNNKNNSDSDGIQLCFSGCNTFHNITIRCQTVTMITMVPIYSDSSGRYSEWATITANNGATRTATWCGLYDANVE